MNDPLLNVSDEEQETLNRGHDYESLKSHPGWKRMLGFLADREKAAFLRMKDSKSSDAAVVVALQRNWQSAADVLEGVQVEVEQGIEGRRQWLEQVRALVAMRVDDQEVRDFLNKEEVLG